MAGVPPTWGFLAKELLLDKFYHLWTHGGDWRTRHWYGRDDWPWAGGGVVMAIFSAGAIFTLVWEAFLRRRADDAEPAQLHHAPSFLVCVAAPAADGLSAP